MIKFIVALLAVFTLMTSPALASDAGDKLLGNTCKQVPGSSVCQDSATQNQAGTNPLNHIVHVAADIVAGLTGIAAVLMIIISAFKLVSGGGSPEAVKSARSTLVAAVIGLAIIGLAWTIINYAITNLILN